MPVLWLQHISIPARVRGRLQGQPHADAACVRAQVAAYMGLFHKRHPVAALYVGLVGLMRTGAEAHALLMLLSHPDMTAGEAFSSFICSHLMTPTINAGLAILQARLCCRILSCSAPCRELRQDVACCGFPVNSDGRYGGRLGRLHAVCCCCCCC